MGGSASFVAHTSPCFHRSGNLSREWLRLSLLDALSNVGSLRAILLPQYQVPMCTDSAEVLSDINFPLGCNGDTQSGSVISPVKNVASVSGAVHPGFDDF